MVLTQVCSTKEKKNSKENSVASRDGKGKNFFCFVDILSLRICRYICFVISVFSIFTIIQFKHTGCVSEMSSS